ncbi:nucleotidyltransferase domain-containing protein [Rossellomorea aquimaris]|uniref:nucleotidyltransferase domain-containing protein n=1 Tax=Rossellomorea aquimaris TaxID=189382 RepID=UPI0006969EDB|nr:nucleotidyltransferase domain-containing protein [Rossellomorea aquimaris]
MRSIILEGLRCIEIEEGIKILYAVEAGSRAWGYHTDDSDYDVRFIYIRETTAYLDLQETKDVIEKTTHHAIEYSGWDLSKSLKLLRKSNPSLLEWLTDENVYIEHPTMGVIRKLRDLTFSPNRCLIHYYHMTKRNMEKLKDEPFSTKKWMTIIRPWLAYEWIMKHRTFPPNGINEMMGHLNMNGDIKSTITSMVTSRGKEIHNLKHLKDYIMGSLLKLDRGLEQSHSNDYHQWGKINETFISILEEVWGVNLAVKER